tara:strand:- start:1842 stop:2336 length:495 start_codon:yes stop_codon:yes gene_type:complete
MDLVNTAKLDILFLIKSDDVFIIDNTNLHDTSRYYKILDLLMKFGYFLMINLREKPKLIRKFPKNIEIIRDLLFGYTEYHFNDKNIYYNILINYRDSTKKLPIKTIKLLIYAIDKNIKLIKHLLNNQNFNKYSKDSRDSFISRVLSVYSVYLIALKRLDTGRKR